MLKPEFYDKPFVWTQISNHQHWQTFSVVIPENHKKKHQARNRQHIYLPEVLNKDWQPTWEDRRGTVLSGIS